MFSSALPELKDAHVAIVGLGLMGGSLALALKPHVSRMTGVDLDGATRHMALERGMVDVVTADLEEGTEEADLIVLATPVSAILLALNQLPRWREDGCYVLDLGSTKRRICAAMDALPAAFAAMGGHPMCGKETAGLAFAEETLYRGHTFVLCPTTRTNDAMLSVARSIVQLIGAKPLLLSAEEHDRQVAAVSHLPYLVAALLMKLAAAAGEHHDAPFALSASGFRDTSRLAGSDPRMMKDIIQTNRDTILDVLRQYAGEVGALMTLLQSEDELGLEQWLQARQQEHRQYRAARESVREAGG